MDKNLNPALFDVNINTDLTPILLGVILWFLYVTKHK